MDPLKVVFLGPLASFSHQVCVAPQLKVTISLLDVGFANSRIQAAAESFAKSSSVLLPQASFADAFSAIQKQEADYAVIPCENSTNGSVVQTLDLLADRNNQYNDVKVCGEYYLTVRHCLLVNKGSYPNGWTGYDGSIRKLYTHPQVWGQCDKFLSQYFKDIERQDVSSTSKAAEIVAEEPNEKTAAIASRFAAEYHGVNVLKENIEDRADNTTRFLILRNVLVERTARLDLDISSLTTTQDESLNTHKTLISFSVNHTSPVLWLTHWLYSKHTA
ncbi:hypothetical protein N7470_000721 [Penicillium chermesinum]|nr:hypothetical protein N7470_000721 [Penicillium chermesinum]